MRKILSIVVLCLFLAVQTSYAFLPVAIPAWYYGAGALAVGGGAGVYCAMKTGYVASLDLSGNLMRKAGVAYVAMSSGLPTLFEKGVTARLSFASLMGAASSKPSTYPNLNAAVQPVTTKTPTTLAVGTQVKEWYVNTGYYKIVRFDKSNTNTWGPSSPAPTDGSYNQKISLNYYGSGRHLLQVGSNWNSQPWDLGFKYCAFYEVSSDSTANDSTIVNPKVSPTPTQLVTKLTTAGAGTDAQTVYQAELDAMLQDDEYVPTFTDDTTGLPLTYPPGVLSPAQVEAYNKQGVAVEERANALTAAQQAAVSAVAARDSAVAAANADPTNSDLAQKAATATAAAAAATAAAQKIAADNATTDAADATKEADETFSSVTIPALKTFSWARLADLRGLLATTFPFNLLDRVTVILGSFVREPVAPSFTLPVYGGNELSISLSVFDTIATFFRWAFASIMTVGIIHRIVVFYRGA